MGATGQAACLEEQWATSPSSSPQAPPGMGAVPCPPQEAMPLLTSSSLSWHEIVCKSCRCMYSVQPDQPTLKSQPTQPYQQSLVSVSALTAGLQYLGVFELAFALVGELPCGPMCSACAQVSSPQAALSICLPLSGLSVMVFSPPHPPHAHVCNWFLLVEWKC